MQIHVGDIVVMNDRTTVVQVTDAPESLEPVQTISHYDYVQYGREVITSSMPAETIFMGYVVKTRNVVDDNGVNSLEIVKTKGRYVSDMSLVTSILNR